MLDELERAGASLSESESTKLSTTVRMLADVASVFAELHDRRSAGEPIEIGIDEQQFAKVTSSCTPARSR